MLREDVGVCVGALIEFAGELFIGNGQERADLTRGARDVQNEERGSNRSPSVFSCSRKLFGTCGTGAVQLMTSTNHRPSSSLAVMDCGNCVGGCPGRISVRATE